MKKFLALCLLLSHSLFAGLEDLPEPYCNLQELLPYDDHGFFVNAPWLNDLIPGRKIQTIIEIGSWLGASTRHMANLLPENGKIYAVDHWLGSSEHQPGREAYHPALSFLYEQFLSNTIHANLTHKIVPVRMDSKQAADYLEDVTPDLIYIDASHDTEAVYQDLVAWYPFIKKGAALCGDDWHWPSVRVAVQRFAKEKGLHIHDAGNFWIFY